MDKKQQKLVALRKYIKSLGSAAIAFSGGTDSSFLLKIAHDELDRNVLAITSVSCFIPRQEAEEAIRFCRNYGIRHIIIRPDILSVPGVAANPPDRCYLCKKALFTMITGEAKKACLAAVCDGSNADDAGDYRPGMRALAELGIKSPLKECGITKEEVRSFSKKIGLSVWNKPPAACLASRVPYNEQLTDIKFAMAEKAELFLRNLGMTQLRVRIHCGNIARIEAVPQEMPIIMQKKAEISLKFKEIGFAYTSLDLQGYRTGSLNEILPKETRN